MAWMVVDEDFDLQGFAEEVQAQLAGYARPLFLRIGEALDTTGTFKHRKVDAVAEGFDPNRITDPLYFLDAKEGTYVPLDATLHRRIVAGELRV